MVRSFARARVVVAVVALFATLGGALVAVPRPAAAATTIAEFPPFTAKDPLEIAVGPDGNLWFTQTRTIGRISTTGVGATFAIPSPARDIVTGPDGNLWFTEEGANKIARLTPAGVVTEFAIPTAQSGPRSITAGPDGNLWFIEAGLGIGKITPAGVITEFPLANTTSLPNAITVGPDGTLWFAEFSANKIGKITTSGTITEYTIPTVDSKPMELAAGPDSNLWFTESGTNKIGRVTTGGTFDESTIPTPNSSPQFITAGPDGNLWFTEYVGKIGRITPTGTITEFPLADVNGQPRGIVAGPDGALWFADQGTQQIGRITTAGVVSGFPEAPVNAPAGIATGPDGNLWFTLSGGNQIGRITPAGTITTFPIPTADSQPEDIAVGSDGALWFTEFGPGKIGRITTAGVVTEFPLTNGTVRRPTGITAGPDGNLWFTQQGRFNNPDLIGRITPAGVITSFPIPTTNGSPTRIVTGPDGNLWFTQTSADQIARITTAGVVTEFPLVDCSCFPMGITVGPDNNLWVAESVGAITRVTTAGVVTDFIVPNEFISPTDVTTGPDGNLWFTAAQSHNVGRLTTAGVFTVFAPPTPASRPYEIIPGPDGNLWFTERDANKIARLTPGAAGVTLTLTASGGGTVAVAPPGAVTGPTTREYPPGTPVTLTPQPAAGQTFTGWTLDGVYKGWANPATLTMDTDHAVQATFAPTKAFPDVPSGRADFTAITALASRGTIRGYGTGNYGPDDGVQRAQMAALIARATSAGPGTPTGGTLVPPACLVAATWDCEDWGNNFTDRNGLDGNLWRNAGTLQHYGIALGYTAADCAAQGKAFPCFGPTDPVTYAETVVFITRAMVAKGYWVSQPGAPQPYAGVPAVFAATVATYQFYTQAAGGVPAPPANWNAGATRGWFARALWQALNTYWGTDGTLPDGRTAGGYVP